MGAGRPILSFANESIREVLRDGENALLVDPPKTRNWERAIRTLLERPEKGKALAERAREGSSRYTWEARGRAIAEFLRRVPVA